MKIKRDYNYLEGGFLTPFFIWVLPLLMTCTSFAQNHRAIIETGGEVDDQNPLVQLPLSFNKIDIEAMYWSTPGVGLTQIGPRIEALPSATISLLAGNSLYRDDHKEGLWRR